MSGRDAYRSPFDLPRSPIGRGGAVLFDPLRGRADVLSPEEAAALAAAGPRGTLDELSANAARSPALRSRAEAVVILSGLAARGVLAPEAEIVERITACGHLEEGPARVATLGVPTRDRPGLLRRALETFGLEIAESGRAIDILVVDGAEGEERPAGAQVREIARRFGVRVRHAGRRAAARFAERVAGAAGAPPGVALRALVPEAGGAFAAGAARNLLLLDAAGRASLQADDDTVCALRAAPSAARGLALRSFEDPAEMWFGDAAGAEEAAPVRGLALLHERLLGRTGSALAREAASGEGLDLRRASTALLVKIASGGRVVCTQLGVRGDSGIGATSYLLTLPEPSRGRLLASEPLYRSAITSRRLARAVTADTVTDLARCMALALGLDGREPLPPFPPLHRNEDGLFGCVLSVCRPAALFGHLPVTVAHEPEVPRPEPVDGVFDQPARLGVNDVIAGLVSASRSEVDTRSPGAAIESLGRCLVAWSQVPDRDLFERLWWMLARSLAQRLARIEALLRESRRAPSFWARDLERLADVIRERATDPARAVPLELRGEAPSSARELTRRRILEYGEILIYWPALLDAAERLRARGEGLGEGCP